MSFGPALMWRMGGETSGFNKAIDSSQKKTSAFKSSLKSVGAAFSIGLAVARLRRLTEEMDKTAKTASKLGVGSDFLQEMRYAAERTGVPINALDMGLQRFTRRVAEAVQGGGELKGTLEKYGIAVTDANGRTRETEEVLGDLAEVIKNTSDPAERLRIAFKAFDSEGVAMVNTLKNGRDGLNELRQAARDTGQVVGEDALKNFEKLNDQLTTLTGSAKALAGNVIGAFLTFGERVGQGAAMIVNDLQGIETVFGEDLPSAVGASADSLEDVETAVANMTAKIETLAKAAELRNKADFETLTTAEKLNNLREREAEIYNTKIAPNQAGTEAWSEGILELTQVGIDYKKLEAQLAKEQNTTAEALAKTTRATLETEAAKHGINVKDLELGGEIVSNYQLQYEINKQILGTGEYAIEQAKQLRQIQQEISQAAWDTYNAKKAATQIGTGGDDIESLSTDKLKYLLAEQGDELRGLGQQTGGAFSIGDKFIRAGIQAFMDRITAELDTRRQFESLSGSAAQNLLFDPFQIDRLNSVTTPQSASQQQTALLESIDQKLEIQNARYSNYG